VTAHLGTTYNGRAVAIYAQPVSGTKGLSGVWRTATTTGCLTVGSTGYANFGVPWGSFSDNALLRVRLHYAPPRANAISTTAGAHRAASPQAPVTRGADAVSAEDITVTSDRTTGYS
jgi:hypothetical protein